MYLSKVCSLEKLSISTTIYTASALFEKMVPTTLGYFKSSNGLNFEFRLPILRSSIITLGGVLIFTLVSVFTSFPLMLH